MVLCPTFYNAMLDSYTVTQGSIGGPRVVGSLYNRAILAKSNK
jgi:hypothetical protein